MHSDERRLLRSGVQAVGLEREAIRSGLALALDQVLRAQRHGRDGGIGSYHLVDGWGASYPETTGYLIPTLLLAGDRCASPAAVEGATKAVEWLLRIQRPDGGWQGGRVDMDRPSIVFNTAQVVRGLLAMHQRTPDARLLEAAVRAGTWMVQAQEVDGAWRTHNFLGVARVYDTYVDAPLLELYTVTGDARYRAAAEKNLAWVLGRQKASGWFADADNTLHRNDRPITHTIAYTIDGLVACGAALSSSALIAAARRAADPLLEIFLREGRLHGRYDERWQGSEAAITTGCAQLAIAWRRLHVRTGEQRYAEGALRMVSWLLGVQRVCLSGPEAVRGALPGSFPVWGRYEKFAFPNWATKYLMDALLAVEPLVPGAVPRT